MMKPSAELAQFLLGHAMNGVPRHAAPKSTPRVRARMATVWAMRRLCPGLSYPTIAHYVGYSDHTSALHAYTRVEAMREDDEEVRLKTDGLLSLAQSEKGKLIGMINNVSRPQNTAEELQSIMTDVRRAAARLNEAVARMDAYLDGRRAAA